MLYLPQALNDLRDDTRVVGRSKTARRWSQRAVRLSAPTAVVAGMLARVYGVQKAAGAGMSL